MFAEPFFYRKIRKKNGDGVTDPGIVLHKKIVYKTDLHTGKKVHFFIQIPSGHINNQTLHWHWLRIPMGTRCKTTTDYTHLAFIEDLSESDQNQIKKQQGCYKIAQ